jgi:hypothetical protein
VIWDGIGAWGGARKLIQAGSWTTGPSIHDLKAFIEVWDKEGEINVSSPAIREGDTVNVETVYSPANGGTATWWFNNLTNSQSQGWYQTGISAWYDGTSAEYINERPGTYLLRKSSLTYWGGKYINGTQSNNFSTTNVTMVNGDTLMTAVMGATTTSSETWRDCGPGTGTNQ